jgi:hypothetical protein
MVNPMAKTKRMYLLPHNDTYSLIDSYHTGSIDGEGYILCDNCNAIISRVGVIKSVETNIINYVGFDCAKTLTSIKQEDINNHLAMFKLGKSVRKSFLNYFKQTVVCKVQIIVKDKVANLYMETDNMGRTSFRKEFTINNVYRNYIYPQISDLAGVFICRKRVPESILNDFINHLEVGMETKLTSYHQRIKKIDLIANQIFLDNLYMGDRNTTSTRPILSVLGDLIYTEHFKELMLKHKLL